MKRTRTMTCCTRNLATRLVYNLWHLNHTGAANEQMDGSKFTLASRKEQMGGYIYLRLHLGHDRG